MSKKFKTVEIECILTVRVEEGSNLQQVKKDIRTEMKNCLASFSPNMSYTIKKASHLRVLPKYTNTLYRW
jgi:hypothetical protein